MTSRPGLVAALREGPVWILARGEPGLGRLVEASVLAGLLPPGASKTFTSRDAVPLARALMAGAVHPFDLQGGRDVQQALLDSAPLHGLLTDLSRRPPAALIVDGYPMLLPLLRRAFGGWLLAIANRHDLKSPGHSRGARLLAETVHAAADVVIIQELRRGWRLTSVRGTPVIQLPAVVRIDAGSTARLPARPVVAILGGGSRGDRALEDSTHELLRSLDAAVQAGEVPACRVYLGADWRPWQAEHPNLEVAREPLTCLADLHRARLAIVRAGRNTLAEVLASGKPAVVVAARSDTLRGLEQHANAARAARLSPAVVPLDIDHVEALGAACQQALSSTPVRWTPGNAHLWDALRAVSDMPGPVEEGLESGP